MLDLHRLRLLRELHRRGTLAAVAQALSYSPSAVSQQLSVLENEAGVTLLERVGRNVRLTGPALTLVEHTEHLFELMERAEAELATSRTGLTGITRIASFQTVAMTLLPDVLGTAAAEHPGMEVCLSQLEPESALPALLAHDFDLVIAEEYPGLNLVRDSQLNSALLLEDPMYLCVPASRPEWTAGSTSALAEAPWVMEPDGSASRAWVTSLCREAGFEPHIRYSADDMILHRTLIARGLAVGFLPGLAVDDAPPEMILHRLARGNACRRIYTVTRRGAQAHPMIVYLRDALSAAAAALTPPSNVHRTTLVAAQS
ncbi:LysR substrate-binding domain-containing protein [Mycolicibacterium sp. YH-1]|uniref:LysR substrate-binding domain-containing protein n=1 Tax=Mycolicibacterium sp. YH-1 TaxID=2908837 RepID=UPI001F4C3520|nr:LysR substrate-binding domain-containing protein [Mycolicibacterium sp. YH-1]UNB52881.1 LysR substrate-binding domain-containing protein [Mycolicibacterium sp. YH-1]